MKKLVPEKAILIPDNAKSVFEGVIYEVYQWPQRLFDGTSATFEMLKRPDTVGAMCIVEDKILVLNDEQPHRGARLTFPGGRSDADEDMTQAIKREVQEETGFRFKNWRLLKVKQPHTKIEWFIYTYLAWDVEARTDPHLDGGEKITVEHLPFEKVKQLVVEKVGYLGEEEDLFMNANSAQDLLLLPEFRGKEVDR
ncbi:MAG: NUDIX hydrolase [Candidatus Saccharimonadales bacterium]|jgi:ADP-ribose pyrophosphatase